MKKLLTITASLLITVSTTVINAQNTLPVSNQKFVSYNSSSETGTANSAPNNRIKELTTLVLNGFKETFPGVTDDAWVKKNNGFFVGFTFKGIQNHAFFTAKGHCNSRIQYYTENELPSGVRNQVKSVYYNYSITSVKEVNCDNSTAYLVTIEDKNLWKVIRVVDGEMDVYEDHKKG